MLPRFFAYDTPLPSWAGESVAVDLRPLAALIVSVVVTSIATCVLFRMTRARDLDLEDLDAAPREAVPYREPDRRHLAALEDIAIPPPDPAPPSPAHAVIVTLVIVVVLAATFFLALFAAGGVVFDKVDPILTQIIWPTIPLVMIQTAIVAAASVRLVHAHAPSRRLIAPMALVGAGALVAVLGHFYVGSLEVGVYELQPASPARVHLGKTREIEPVLMTTYYSGFFSVSSSYEPLHPEHMRGWTPEKTTLSGESLGFRTTTLRASRPFVELRRQVQYEVAADGAPAVKSTLPVAVGSTWIFEGDSRFPENATLSDRLAMTVAGEHDENGLHVKDILVARTDPGRGLFPLERIMVYAWKGELFVLPDGWREKDELFFEGFVDGDCTIATLPWYKCTCATRGKDQTIAGPIMCRSGDLSSGVEKAIVGVFTLGFGDATRYHTLRLVKAGPTI